MIMDVRQRYRCQNPDCRCEIEVTKTSTEAACNPRCCCGAEMKKLYKEPTFKTWDTRPEFLADIRNTRN
jgi:hypothetical protein